MKLRVNIDNGYDIIIKQGALNNLSSLLDYNHKILIVRDVNVPESFLSCFQKDKVIVFNFEASELSKSFSTVRTIIDVLIANNFSRKDYLIALGGGVTGDLVGFVASIFKRGCHYINIPTTTLSMIDSSVGGKVAINYQEIKNVIGSFYQPCLVVIDPNVLSSLPRRHYYNGLVEALKMGLILDKDLYNLFKTNIDDFEMIIVKSLRAKIRIVETDFKENGLRKVLNFGHTIGHAVESMNLGKLFHGEAVAIGMMYMIDNIKLREEVEKILLRMHINSHLEFDLNKAFQVIKNDKKADGNNIDIIILKDLEEFEIKSICNNELLKILERGI